MTGIWHLRSMNSGLMLNYTCTRINGRMDLYSISTLSSVNPIESAEFSNADNYMTVIASWIIEDTRVEFSETCDALKISFVNYSTE